MEEYSTTILVLSICFTAGRGWTVTPCRVTDLGTSLLTSGKRRSRWEPHAAFCTIGWIACDLAFSDLATLETHLHDDGNDLQAQLHGLCHFYAAPHTLENLA